MRTLEDNLAIIIQRLGVAIITERDGNPGWCISDGGASEVCAVTLADAAARFVALLDAGLAGPLEYPQRSE